MLWTANLRRGQASPILAPGVRIQEVDARSAARIVAAMGEEGDLVEPRLTRGCRCFATGFGGDVVGYGWLSTGPEWIGELGLEIRPAAGEGYVWNCVTLPAHRRRGLFRSLLQTVVDQARREGLDRLWIGTVDAVGHSAVTQAAFEPVLRIGFVEVSWCRWLSVASAAGADAGTVTAALEALGGGRGRLRPGPRFRGRRRH